MPGFLLIVAIICYLCGGTTLFDAIGTSTSTVFQQQVVHQRMLIAVVLLALGVAFTAASWACDKLSPPKPEPKRPAGPGPAEKFLAGAAPYDTPAGFPLTKPAIDLSGYGGYTDHRPYSDAQSVIVTWYAGSLMLLMLIGLIISYAHSKANNSECKELNPSHVVCGWKVESKTKTTPAPEPQPKPRNPKTSAITR